MAARITAVGKATNAETWYRALGRVSGRKLRGNRIVNATVAGATVTLKSTARTARVLWLEVTGFLFGAVAVIVGAATFRAYQHHLAGQSGPERAYSGAVIAALFAYFSITSFWKSRRVR